MDAFGIEVDGLVCADLGASTGGFTDVLLQRGAKRVYAIDVGYGQLHWPCARPPLWSWTRERSLSRRAPRSCTSITIDASFISLRLILPAARRLLASDGQIVALIEPQFEAGRDQIGKGGVVRDAQIHRQVLVDVVNWCEAEGLNPQGLIPSPLFGPRESRIPPLATSRSPIRPRARLFVGVLRSKVQNPYPIVHGPACQYAEDRVGVSPVQIIMKLDRR